MACWFFNYRRLWWTISTTTVWYNHENCLKDVLNNPKKYSHIQVDRAVEINDLLVEEMKRLRRKDENYREMCKRAKKDDIKIGDLVLIEYLKVDIMIGILEQYPIPVFKVIWKRHNGLDVTPTYNNDEGFEFHFRYEQVVSILTEKVE